MNVIQFQDVTLDFPVKGGAPTYLKEQVTGRFRKDGRRSRFALTRSTSKWNG